MKPSPKKAKKEKKKKWLCKEQEKREKANIGTPAIGDNNISTEDRKSLAKIADNTTSMRSLAEIVINKITISTSVLTLKSKKLAVVLVIFTSVTINLEASTKWEILQQVFYI